MSSGGPRWTRTTIILTLGGIVTSLEMGLGVGRGWAWRPGHRWAGRPAFGQCLGWLHRGQSWVPRRGREPSANLNFRCEPSFVSAGNDRVRLPHCTHRIFHASSQNKTWMDAAQGAGGAVSDTNLRAVAEALLHIPGQHNLLGLLTPSAADAGCIRILQQRAGRSRSFGADPASSLLRRRNVL